MFQIFGHLYETVVLIVMCPGDFPGYQAADKGCKQLVLCKARIKIFPSNPADAAQRHREFCRKVGKSGKQ